MHVDPELVALLALGEDAGTKAERLHAQTCPACVAELAELQRVVALGRSVGDDELVSPAPAVWDRIRVELAVAPAAPADPDRAPADLTADLVTAYARLDPVSEDWSLASGSAELATDERGRRLLQLVLHADPPSVGVRQAWLVHRDDPGRRHALGMLDGPYGVWTVDHSIDLRTYAVVDVSESGSPGEEPSRRTVVRGELSLAG